MFHIVLKKGLVHTKLAFAAPADEDLTPESLAHAMSCHLDENVRRYIVDGATVNSRFFDDVDIGFDDPDGNDVDCSSAMASLSQMPLDERRAWQ